MPVELHGRQRGRERGHERRRSWSHDWLLKRRMDVLVLELGGNDGLRGIPVEATKANLQAIIDRVKQKNPLVKVILAGMHMPPNMGEQYNTAFQKIFSDLAKATKAALVPFFWRAWAAGRS